ncbi:MAG TPA: hypothetical protein PKZ75_15045 [Bacteroidia bacterium]|nr:hypothetical protein [Bacteroidia bacterium]
MLEQIENLEEIMNDKPSTVLIEGFESLLLALSLASSGNNDLIKQLEDVR